MIKANKQNKTNHSKTQDPNIFMKFKNNYFFVNLTWI